MRSLVWEIVPSPYSDSFSVSLRRAKIPGGWLVVAKSKDNDSITFVPDPEYKWQ